MGTKLGDVSIKLTLDTSGIEGDLRALETRTRATGGGRASAAPRWRSMEEAQPEWQSIDEGDRTSASWFRRQPRPMQMSKREIDRWFDKMDEERERRMRSEAARGKARATRHPASGASISQPVSVSDVPGLERVSQRLGFSGMQSVTPASTGALAAGIYTAASATAQALPYVGAVSRGLGGGSSPLDALEEKFENLRAIFVQFESYLKGLYSGYTKALNMSGAVARVTGQMPTIPIPGVTSSSSYYKLFADYDENERALEKKFEEFQGKDIAQAFGGYMRESFKRALTR